MEDFLLLSTYVCEWTPRRLSDTPLSTILSTSLTFETAVGALIPYLETYYRIGYAVVSMLFVGNAVGFILSAFFVNMTLGKLGRAKTLLLSETIIIAGYLMLVTAPPYPVVVVGYVHVLVGAVQHADVLSDSSFWVTALEQCWRSTTYFVQASTHRVWSWDYVTEAMASVE